MNTLSAAEQRQAISLLRREQRKVAARERFYQERQAKIEAFYAGRKMIQRPVYREGYKLSITLKWNLSCVLT